MDRVEFNEQGNSVLMVLDARSRRTQGRASSM
jgi:hypothetical protein